MPRRRRPCHLGFNLLFGSTSSGGNSKLAGILDVLLDDGGLFEFDLADGGNGQQVLETIGSQIGNTSLELGAQILGLSVQDLGLQDRARVIDLVDDQTVREGRNVQHVQQGCLGGADLVTGLQDGHIVDDFNCTLGNLGGYGQSLEERGLFGTQTSVLSGNGDGQGSSSGRSLHLGFQTSFKSPLVKTKPTLPLIWGKSFSS